MISADILGPMCSWERHFYAEFVRFNFFDVACPAKSFLCKNSINVSNVKLFSIFFFNSFGFFIPFWWKCQLAFYILSDFPGIKNLNGLNDLNLALKGKTSRFTVDLGHYWPRPVTLCFGFAIIFTTSWAPTLTLQRPVVTTLKN